jgi:hypothetical protein
MPQASEELRAKFPEGEGQAMKVLEANFILHKGFVYRPKVRDYKPTPREDDAIDYLFHEWDFAYEPQPLTEKI